jgi:Planctomycete cytochrome C
VNNLFSNPAFVPPLDQGRFLSDFVRAMRRPSCAVVFLWTLLRLGSLEARPEPSVALIARDDPEPAQLEFFEKKVRPILANHCYNCHSADTKPAGGLRVDDRVGLVTGVGQANFLSQGTSSISSTQSTGSGG